MATETKALNSTVKSEVERVAAIYKAKGLNWDAKASATVIVRTILIESGNKEQAESTDPIDREFRLAMINAIMPFQTAPINVQRTTLAPLKLMPDVKAAAAVVADELA